jgi:hypothetical protein
MYIYVRNINLTSVSTIVLLDFRTVLTVCYFRFFILSHNTSSLSQTCDLFSLWWNIAHLVLINSRTHLCCQFKLLILMYDVYTHTRTLFVVQYGSFFLFCIFISKLDIKNRSKFNFHLLSLHELVRWFIFNKKQFISGFDISGSLQTAT